MKGLIIDEPWISLILSGQKTWELRSRNIRVRGPIALIRKGSGAVIGTANLTGTLPTLAQSNLRSNFAKHRVPISEIGKDFKWSTAWVLVDPRQLFEAVPYQHPTGAVIWVNLAPAVGASVERAKWTSGSQTHSPPASPG